MTHVFSIRSSSVRQRHLCDVLKLLRLLTQVTNRIARSFLAETIIAHFWFVLFSNTVCCTFAFAAAVLTDLMRLRFFAVRIASHVTCTIVTNFVQLLRLVFTAADEAHQ